MGVSKSLSSINRIVWIAVMAALVAVGAYVKIPLGTIPFSMQTFFVIMAGFVLGPAGALFSLGLYLAAGIIGLPVYVGGGAGFGHLLGPTGGYLVGFVACACICGLAASGDRPGEFSVVKGAFYAVLGMLVLYALGVGRLKFLLDMTWTKAFTVGMLPFMPGAAVKIALAVTCRKFMAARRILVA